MNDAKTLTPDMIPVSVRSTNSLDKQPWNSRQLTIEIPETGVSFDEVEKQVIAHMLKMTHWNRNKAARMLRISRPRLMRKIEKYHLPAPTTFLNEEDT